VTKSAPVNPCEAEGPDYEYKHGKGCVKKTSTTTPPSRDPALSCSPGQRYDYTEKRCITRPVKNIGKAKTGESASTDDTPAALKPIRDCKAKGWRWDQSAAKCIKPSEAKADCEAKGHTYDLDTGRCVKSLKKGEPQVAEPEVVTQQPRKKKKKKKHYDEDDDDGDRY
jgi:hypothetical protein